MFTSVASVYHQAREELRKPRPPTVAASLSDLPEPLPLPTAEVNSQPVTQTPSPNPALRSLYGSSMNLDEDIPEIDLGDPTGPFAVQHVSSETYVVIDMNDIGETSLPQSLETTCCPSVFSFIKRLFTLY
ncbi:uncharacterized protein LOC124289363 isoform X2 [Haliotis rubra]|uniref:uncharacterized protein LOC124289363 isoform X2 n=1 Tax=Haliotis rubra TaxID=36100 RepID=UPI001EE569EF|nr:uncharacterized protein LOC124289363 isoform X2 [Haliotis rubra]